MRIVWAFLRHGATEYVLACECGQEFYHRATILRVRCPHCKKADSMHAIMAKANPREGATCRMA